MMALSKQMQEHDPSEIELLLPWYAAGTLKPGDIKRVEEALASDPALARQYAAIQREYAETIALNETLGAPSRRAMQKLFAAIDAEPTQAATPSRGLGRRLLGFFESLSPRALAWSASFGILLVLAQAGIIAAVLMRSQPATFQTASLNISDRGLPEPLTRAIGRQTRAIGPTQLSAASVHALVRFAPDARISDITTLLNNYKATIIDGARGGLFTLQLGDRPMSQDEVSGLIARLQREKIVSLAVAAP
jgi:anti-sigma factor RsiW